MSNPKTPQPTTHNTTTPLLTLLPTITTQSLTLLLLSTLIHTLATSLDTLYTPSELPHPTTTTTTTVNPPRRAKQILGTFLFIAWHICLGRLSIISATLGDGQAASGGRQEGSGRGKEAAESYRAKEKEKNKNKNKDKDKAGGKLRASWSRVLGRILVPLFLTVACLAWAVRVARAHLFMHAMGLLEGSGAELR